MAYAEIEDVLARSGRLRDYFSEQSQPSTTDIERWLDETSGAVDGVLRGLGAEVPIADEDAQELVRGLVADYVLILALQAAFPQGTDSSAGPTAAAANALVESAKERNAVEWIRLAGGDHAVVVALVPGASATPDASDFWSDNPDYRADLEPGGNWRLLPGVSTTQGV